MLSRFVPFSLFALTLFGNLQAQQTKDLETNMQTYGCEYYSPSSASKDVKDLIQGLRNLSQDENSSFLSILDYFQDIQQYCHRFEFKYPIPDEIVLNFCKTLEIKAREAH